MTLRDRNSVKMVAEHWGCSTRTVNRMIKRGTLSALRLGGLVRITREQVEACETAAHTKAKLDQERQRVAAFRATMRLSVFQRGQQIAWELRQAQKKK
jgi:excisionase family DNA binding protein